MIVVAPKSTTTTLNMDGSEEEAILASLAELESEGSRGCCIKNCKNYTFRTDAIYFSVPEDPDRHAVWLKLLSEYISGRNERPQLWICSDHFHSSDITHTNSQPELTPSALPHIQGYAQAESSDNDKDGTENWEDDNLNFTCKKASLFKMSVETDDGPRPIDSCHQLLDSSLDAQNEQNASVKMEPLSEVEDPYTSFVNSVVTSETPNTAEGKSIMLSGARKVKMNISSQVMEKFLKEGKLEKQPCSSYRVMDSEFKEIETSISGEVNSSENNSVGRLDHILPSADSHSTPEPSNPAVVFRRKRGRPRKGTFIPRTTQSHTDAMNHSSKLSSSLQIGKLTCKTSLSPLAYDSTEDPGDAETDTENKPKRKRRSKILDDYVTDFNTSDEEEVNLMNSFSKFTHRGRGRGRGRKVEPLDSLDDDLLTSCVGVFGKKFSLNEDILDEDMLEDMSEIDDIYSPSISNKLKSFSVPKQGSELKEGIEVVLGPDGKTKIQIVDTGETSVVNDEESLIYHVITTTGKTTNVTPLKIPKMPNDAESEDDDKNLPSTSNMKSIQSDEGKADTDVELVGSKPKISSRGRRIKSKQMIRTYNQQVASLQQRYCRAVQELRKKPRVYTLADLVYGASRFLTEDQLIFFTLQLKSGCNNVQGIRFSVREKMLALAFYIQSPALYKWMRVIFHLPTKLILERWLESIAKSDPDAVKRLIYHVYTRYVFRS